MTPYLIPALIILAVVVVAFYFFVVKLGRKQADKMRRLCGHNSRYVMPKK